jgi:hypothetical protein
MQDFQDCHFSRSKREIRKDDLWKHLLTGPDAGLGENNQRWAKTSKRKPEIIETS